MKAGTNLEKVLEAGNFAVTAEIGPPKGGSAKVIESKGETLRHAADAFNVTDNQTAVVRMSSLAACGILKSMGLDPVMQMLCRDRNRIMLQGDVCGAVALGVGNLLCLPGDHVKFGNHPEAKVVFDIDSVQLIQAVKNTRGEARQEGQGRRRLHTDAGGVRRGKVRAVDGRDMRRGDRQAYAHPRRNH